MTKAQGGTGEGLRRNGGRGRGKGLERDWGRTWGGTREGPGRDWEGTGEGLMRTSNELSSQYTFAPWKS